MDSTPFWWLGGYGGTTSVEGTDFPSTLGSVSSRVGWLGSTRKTYPESRLKVVMDGKDCAQAAMPDSEAGNFVDHFFLD